MKDQFTLDTQQTEKADSGFNPLDAFVMLRGDCLEHFKNIKDGSVDLIVTDPPYEIIDMTTYFNLMLKKLTANGSMYIFGDKNIVAEYWFSQLKMPNKEILTWYYKNSPKPKGRWRLSQQSIVYAYYDGSIFNENAVRVEYTESAKKLNGRKRPSSGRLKECKPYNTERGALPRDVIEHPALLGHLAKERYGHRDQKPLGLVVNLIKASSNINDVVLDPFMGTGTTGEAAKILKRRFIGIEKTDWFEIAKQRIEAT